MYIKYIFVHFRLGSCLALQIIKDLVTYIKYELTIWLAVKGYFKLPRNRGRTLLDGRENTPPPITPNGSNLVRMPSSLSFPFFYIRIPFPPFPFNIRKQDFIHYFHSKDVERLNMFSLSTYLTWCNGYIPWSNSEEENVFFFYRTNCLSKLVVIMFSVLTLTCILNDT